MEQFAQQLITTTTLGEHNQTREEVQVSLDALCQNFSEVFEKLYLGQ